MKKIAAIICIAVLTGAAGCAAIHKEIIAIDGKKYESIVIETAAGEKEGSLAKPYTVRLTALKQRLENGKTAPIALEYRIGSCIGDPGLGNKSTIMIDTTRIDLPVTLASSAVDNLDPKFRQVGFMGITRPYQTTGTVLLSDAALLALKNASTFSISINTYKSSFHIKLSKKEILGLKELL